MGSGYCLEALDRDFSTYSAINSSSKSPAAFPWDIARARNCLQTASSTLTPMFRFLAAPVPESFFSFPICMAIIHVFACHPMPLIPQSLDLVRHIWYRQIQQFFYILLLPKLSLRTDSWNLPHSFRFSSVSMVLISCKHFLKIRVTS